MEQLSESQALEMRKMWANDKLTTDLTNVEVFLLQCFQMNVCVPPRIFQEAATAVLGRKIRYGMARMDLSGLYEEYLTIPRKAMSVPWAACADIAKANPILAKWGAAGIHALASRANESSPFGVAAYIADKVGQDMPVQQVLGIAEIIRQNNLNRNKQ